MHGPLTNSQRGLLIKQKSKAASVVFIHLGLFCSSHGSDVRDRAIISVRISVTVQEGAVGSVRVSGLVCSADSDPSGEPGTCSTG